jgi:hypothetical protein
MCFRIHANVARKSVVIGPILRAPFPPRRKSTGVRRLLSSLTQRGGVFCWRSVIYGLLSLDWLDQSAVRFAADWLILLGVYCEKLNLSPTDRARRNLHLGLLLPARDDRGENIIGLILSVQEVNRLPCVCMDGGNFEQAGERARAQK